MSQTGLDDGIGVGKKYSEDSFIILSVRGGGTFAVVVAVACSSTGIGTGMGRGTVIGIRTVFFSFDNIGKDWSVKLRYLVGGVVNMMIGKVFGHIEVRDSSFGRSVLMRMLMIAVIIDWNKRHGRF